MYNASMQLSNLNVIQRSIFWYDIIHLSPALHPVTNSRCKSPFRTILILTKGDSSQTKFTFIPDIFPSLSLSLSLSLLYYFSLIHTHSPLLDPKTHNPPTPIDPPFFPIERETNNLEKVKEDYKGHKTCEGSGILNEDDD